MQIEDNTIINFKMINKMFQVKKKKLILNDRTQNLKIMASKDSPSSYDQTDLTV